MDAYLGKTGRITKVHNEKFLVGVDGHEEWWYSPRWLTKVSLANNEPLKTNKQLLLI